MAYIKSLTTGGLERLISHLPGQWEKLIWLILPKVMGDITRASLYLQTPVSSSSDSPAGSGEENAGDENMVHETGHENKYKGHVLVAVPGTGGLKERIASHLDGYRVVYAENAESALMNVKAYSFDAAIIATPMLGEENLRTGKAKSFLEEFSSADILLPAVFLIRRDDRESRLALNFKNTAGSMYISELRDAAKLSELETKINEAIHDSAHGIRRVREIYQSSLWKDHREELQDQATLEASAELGEKMRYLVEKMPEEPGTIHRMTGDSIRGAVSTPAFQENFRPGVDYRSVARFAYVIKSFNSKEEAIGAFTDYSRYSSGDLAKPLKYYESPQDGKVYVIFERLFSPNNLEIMRVLNPKMGSTDGNIIEGIIRASHRKAIEWFIRATHDAHLPANPLEAVADMYLSRIRAAWEIDEGYCRSLVLSEDLKNAAAEEARIKLLSMHARFLGRPKDNAPQNSGLPIYRVAPTREEVINELSRFAETPKKMEEYAYKNWSSWDPYLELNEDGTFQPKHALEDLFHIEDRTSRPETKKASDYSDFMRLLVPEYFRVLGVNKEINNFFSDFCIVGFYRAFRNHSLSIHNYSINNEAEWRHFRLRDRKTYTERREEYSRQWMHHANQAAKYAAVGEIFLSDTSYKNRSFASNIKEIGELMSNYVEGTLDLRNAESSALFQISRMIAAAALREDRYREMR